MNLFEFLTNTIEFAYLGVGHFVVAFLMTGLVGIMMVAMIGAIANFRLFSLTKKKESEGPTLKLSQSTSESTSQQSNIYDLLAEAYDRYKTKKNNKDSGEDK